MVLLNPSYVIHFDKSKIESINDLANQFFESLDLYSKLIPYDAVVLGKNDGVVTISSGKEFDFEKRKKCLIYIRFEKERTIRFINL